MARRFLPLAIVSMLLLALASGARADEAGDEFFEKEVRPILASRCYECHSGKAKRLEGGLRLDSRAAALTGGDTGPAVVPGKPKESLLVDAINYGELYQMPPKTRLPAAEVAVLTKWVELGAPWPAVDSAVNQSGPQTAFDRRERKAAHWCWQPISPPALPQIRNSEIHNPIDAFILAKLQAQGLSPAPPADPRTLIRRLYFDLIGLPPTPEEVESFIAALSPSPTLPLSHSSTSEGERGRVGDREKGYEALVDRLLDSPHFGERWGRHWLDLVRYAESRGHEFDYTIPNAFEYRDYVIRALNADVPYDQFVIEHVAGDLLAKPRLNPKDGANESILGTGFWFLGEWCHSPVDIRKDECDRVDNQIDVFAKTFLGLTVSCARCHDHKFDAISQRDYYALAGYLQSSSYRLTRFATWKQDKLIAGELDRLDADYAAEAQELLKGLIEPKAADLAAALAKDWPQRTKEIGVEKVELNGCEVVADYGKLPQGAWMADGFAFGHGPVPAGTLLLGGSALNGVVEAAPFAAARSRREWSGLAPGAGSETDQGRLSGWQRAGRTLKTPTFTLKSGQVHYLIEGAGHVYAAVDSHAMINGPLHGELVKETGGNSNLPARWITHDLSRYVGHRVHLEFSPKEGEDFFVRTVVQGDRRPAPPSLHPNPLLEKIAAQSAREEARLAACRELVTSVLSKSGRRDAERAAVFNWLLKESGIASDPPQELADLLARYQEAKEAVGAKIEREARLGLAMWQGTLVDEQLLIRGNHKTVGPVVPRRFLEALSPADALASEGRQPPNDDVSQKVVNNRLALAHQLVDPANPLASRVLVNRVWHHLFGRGIVPSTDNFGVLGQEPTHPELLDYLAQRFMQDGWSVKRLIRSIVLSETYRQASVVGDSEQEPGDGGQRTEKTADPQNLLFHRQNIKRLEGEALRDAILAVSGRLDRTQFGPSVPVHLTPFMQGRGRPGASGPLDGAGRRSVYVAVRRNFLSPMMLAFDTPVPFSTVGKRNVSNVPAQALILMNDPFVAEQSRTWAERILADKTSATPEARIHRMYLAAFSREPASDENAAALAFLEEQGAEHQLTPAAAVNDARVWADLAHVLYNVKEFVLIR